MTIWSVMIYLMFPLGYVYYKCVHGMSLKLVARKFISLYGRGWIFLMSPFVSFDRENLKKDIFDGKGIIVVNHLSLFDTYFLGALPFFNLIFIVKTQVFKIYWYTLFMRMAGYVDVENLDLEKTVDVCRKSIEDGGYLVFFPEGTRSRDGKMHRFHSGAFKLAIELGVPVVPLCITGTNVLMPPGRAWLNSCRVKLKVLAPIDSAQYSGEEGHYNFRKDVKKLMLENVEEMTVA
jgi:1-acyl-sn-glycerol-3-phosphate acyltransferase